MTADASTTITELGKTGQEMKVFFRSFIDFFRDDGPLLAGSITYFFLMSFIPFCLIIVAVFGYVLGEHRELYDHILTGLVRFFPAATHEIAKELTAVVTYKGIGLLTFAVYSYFSYQLYIALQTAIHIIFRQEKKRSFFFSLLLAYFIITLIVLFIVASFAATSAVLMIGSLAALFPSLEILRVGMAAGFLVGVVIPALFVLMIAMVLYRLLPRKRVAMRSAFFGGLFTAVFLEAAKHLFTFYVVTAAAQLGSIYGSLATFVIFLMWIFYSAVIFLVGAEIVRNLELPGAGRK